MDSKEIVKTGLQELGNLKEPILSSPASLKPIESEETKKKRKLNLIKEIPWLMSRFGIPPKFIEPDFKGSLSLDYVSKGVCLTGKTGTGKTMAICLLVRDWLLKKVEESKSHEERWADILGRENQRGWQETAGIKRYWKFVVYPEFIMQVQDSYRHDKGEETALSLLDSLAEVPRLILDDLGAEKPTEYVRQATYYIINHREMHLLPTFITSNFSMDYLDENIDPRISSRIAGMCEIIRYEGKDRRINK